jgi:protein phosphatase
MQSVRNFMIIEFGHGTHVGLRREHNEDTYHGDASLGLWLVADGMGGHEHGEIASAIARSEVVAAVERGEPLDAAIDGANRAIIEHAQGRREDLPMGTTIVAVRLQDQRFEAAWVGDSRIYHWHSGNLRQISADHSYVRTLVEQGIVTPEQARRHPHRNVITQALGVTDPGSLRIERVDGSLARGDQLLLCSDGLTEEVDEASIGTLLAREDIGTQECVDQLILAALDHGGSDNITAILVRVR